MKTSWFFILFPGLLFFLTRCHSGHPDTGPPPDEQLLGAVLRGNRAALDSALQRGASPDLRDEEGTPVIILAASTRQKDLVSELVKAGAAVNARREGYYHSTALMEITPDNDTALAHFLLDKGADVHLRDTFGDPAINWAAYYGHIELVDLLIRHGARWDVESRNGTAVDIAMKQWNDPLLEFFIRKGAGTALGPEERALVSAVEESRATDVARLLNSGADPRQRDELGTPVLIIAASKGSLPTVKVLLQEGADINAMNRVGQTALARAARFGHRDIVKWLLDRKADVNAAGEKYRLTPLISAAVGGNPEIGRLLIGKGADLNAQDGISGFSPLMFATAYNQVAFVRLLVEAGANPHLKGVDGVGLYDMVSFGNNPEIGKILQDYLMAD